MPAEQTTLRHAKGRFTGSLWSRGFLGPVIAVGGVQLMAAMDGPVVVFALPRIQSELGLSDAGRSSVVTAYLLAFGGLILLGGRLGDTIGRRRTFIIGVSLFTLASVICGVAWNAGALVLARLLHGAAAAVVTPTCTALLATAFPKGPARNAATAVFGATASIGAVLGLVVGGVLTGVSWRLAFLINVPIGLLVIFLARRNLQETQTKRMRLDVAGAILTTLTFTAAAFGLSIAPEQGWLSAPTIGLGLVALVGFIAFILVERSAENPLVPLNLFFDRNRLAVFVALFLVAGVAFSLMVLVALYVQNIMGYSPVRAGIGFIPLAISMAVGTAVSSRLVTWFSPRVIVIGGGMLVLTAIVYAGLTLSRHVPYFPNLMVPIVVGAVGIGIINVPLGLSLVASVGIDRIGPTSAIAVMLQSLGGPLVLVVIQVIITLRTLQLGGTTGPIASMNPAQLSAVDVGHTYGVLWLAAVVALLCGVALFIGYTAQQVAHAQKVKSQVDAEELDVQP
jgi:EmrB/QacA subfamily drug resistance transporter